MIIKTWYKLADCPVHDVRVKLCAAGLRSTRQRMALGRGGNKRHWGSKTREDE